jgi:hypothetical protein
MFLNKIVLLHSMPESSVHHFVLLALLVLYLAFELLHQSQLNARRHLLHTVVFLIFVKQDVDMSLANMGKYSNTQHLLFFSFVDIILYRPNHETKITVFR